MDNNRRDPRRPGATVPEARTGSATRWIMAALIVVLIGVFAWFLWDGTQTVNGSRTPDLTTEPAPAPDPAPDPAPAPAPEPEPAPAPEPVPPAPQ